MFCGVIFSECPFLLQTGTLLLICMCWKHNAHIITVIYCTVWVIRRKACWLKKCWIFCWSKNTLDWASCERINRQTRMLYISAPFHVRAVSKQPRTELFRTKSTCFMNHMGLFCHGRHRSSFNHSSISKEDRQHLFSRFSNASLYLRVR